jgi:hypothetical protein
MRGKASPRGRGRGRRESDANSESIPAAAGVKGNSESAGEHAVPAVERCSTDIDVPKTADMKGTDVKPTATTGLETTAAAAATRPETAMEAASASIKPDNIAATSTENLKEESVDIVIKQSTEADDGLEMSLGDSDMEVIDDVMLIDSEEEGRGKDAALGVSTSDDDMAEFMKSLGVKGAIGFLELAIAGSPALNVVASETRALRARRRVVLHGVRPSDLTNPALLALTESEMCNHLRLECDRLKHSVTSWTGDLELLFGSLEVALSATATLRSLRDGVTVEHGVIPGDTKPQTTEQSKFIEDEMKPWFDLIVIVKNISSPADDACKVKLTELFPDADIAFHKDVASDVLKG